MLLTKEDRQRVYNAVTALSDNNPDFITQLEKLAELKKTKPALWEAGKKILKL
jgi:hypothetical protein